MAYKHKTRRTIFPSDNKLYNALGETLVKFCRMHYKGSVKQLALDCQNPKFYGGKKIPVSFFMKLQHVESLKEYPKLHNIAYLFSLMGVNIWDVITIKSAEQLTQDLNIVKEKAGHKTMRRRLTKRQVLKLETEARKEKLRLLELKGVNIHDPKFKLSEDYKVGISK